MQKWIDEVRNVSELTDELRDYCLRRGGKPETIDRLGLFTWEADYYDPCPADGPEAEFFIKKFGDRGHGPEWRTDLDGWLAIPVETPLGRTIGIEFRNTREKDVRKFHLDRASWNPVWVGIQGQMEKILSGSDIYVVEGLFDLFAMEWAVPDRGVVLSTERAGFTWEHKRFIVRWLHRYAHLNVVYDNDKAGQRAVFGDKEMNVWGVLDSLKAEGVDNARSLKYKGKDPGDLWDKGGAELLRRSFRLL